MPGLLSRGGAAASIAGMPAVGNTLLAVLGLGFSGGTFQWRRDGVDIAGATGAAYLVLAGDAGKVIDVRISGLVYTPVGVRVPAAAVTNGWVEPGWVVDGWVL